MEFPLTKDTVTLSNLVLLSIIWVLIFPYITYSLYKYIKYKRHKVYFQKRKPLLIDIVICLVLSGIFFENQCLIILAIFFNKLDKSIFAEGLRFFNISSMMAIYMIIMIRIYLLYFQSQYNEATISQKWKEYVNEEHEDFFLSNIHSFGNDKFLIKLCSIIWIILCAIYIVLEVFIHWKSIASWFIFGIFIFLFIFAFNIRRKFPDFHDTLYIRKELQYFVSLNFLVICIWIILLSLSSEVTSGLIRHYSQVIMYWIIFWISINRVIAWNEVELITTDRHDLVMKQMKDTSFGLKKVLELPKGYEQFMKFLVSEFATENLLFVTEYIQLKSLLSLSDKEMKSLKVMYWLTLPENLPIPKIIQDLNLDLEQIKATQTYRKDKQLKRDKLMQESMDFEKNSKNGYTISMAAHSPPAASNIVAVSSQTPTLSTPVSPAYSDAVSPSAGDFMEEQEEKLPNTENKLKTHHSIKDTIPIDTIEENLEINIAVDDIDKDNDSASLSDDIIRPVTYSATVTALAKMSDDDDYVFNKFVQNSTDFDGTLKPYIKQKTSFNTVDTEKIDDSTDIVYTETRASFIEEMKIHKSEVMMHELLAIPSVSVDDHEADTDIKERVKEKEVKVEKKRRHHSLSLKNQREESVPSVKLSQRVRNHSAMLSHQIRDKSKKLKSKMTYHMREASQSVARKYNMKSADKFNVLDCKSFSILCTKLYYKYIASGVAPMEVNISSATRLRCRNMFRKAPTLSAPDKPGGRGFFLTRPRTISRGVVSMLSKKRHLVSRNDALDILKGKTFSQSVSKKKLSMNDTDEPFNGDIVIAMSQLLPPLEQCAVELDNLLRDSLSRFKKTRSCCKLYEEYLIIHSKD